MRAIDLRAAGQKLADARPDGYDAVVLLGATRMGARWIVLANKIRWLPQISLNINR
jgi:hypothetical protein